MRRDQRKEGRLMGAKAPSSLASQDARNQALAWVRTAHAEKWAQLLGDAREARGLPRTPSMGRTPHGTFKSWVRHIERGEAPCRLCTEAMEKATALVRPPADGVPADPVELPKVPSGPEVLQCEDCDYTVDASSVTRRTAMAMHVRKRHGRALLDSEAKPVTREAAA